MTGSPEVIDKIRVYGLECSHPLFFLVMCLWCAPTCWGKSQRVMAYLSSALRMDEFRMILNLAIQCHFLLPIVTDFAYASIPRPGVHSSTGLHDLVIVVDKLVLDGQRRSCETRLLSAFLRDCGSKSFVFVVCIFFSSEKHGYCRYWQLRHSSWLCLGRGWAFVSFAQRSAGHRGTVQTLESWMWFIHMCLWILSDIAEDAILLIL